MPHLHQRNLLRATCCAQQAARNLMLVARNKLRVARNKLRWCKRGIRLIAETDVRSVGDSHPSCSSYELHDMFATEMHNKI